MSDLSSIRLFSTQPHECSYLEGEEATTLFVDPDLDISQDLYSQLSAAGFRRSGKHLYRPHCESCHACVPTRIPVNELKLNRQQRRCLKRNQDLRVTFCDSLSVEQHYPLYERYISLRHYDGAMFPPSPEQFESFLSSRWGGTQFMEIWLENELLAVAVTDQLKQGLSAVYTFFDPASEKRSLGVFSLLKQAEEAQKRKLDYLYLGYWIKDCQKMRYKTDYRPTELLSRGEWRRVD